MRALQVVIEASGTIDDRDSAYPQAVQLPGGDLLCSYSNAGGSLATGGTDWSRSTDGGRTWTVEGTLLAAADDPPSSNFLKLSRAPDEELVYAYGARLSRQSAPRFGDRRAEAVLCRSRDSGRTWSEATVVPMPTDRLEISHGVVPLGHGRLLAPAATLEPGRLGERVLVARSFDSGRSWRNHAIAAVDPDGTDGYLEHKFAVLGDGRVLVTMWTVRMRDMNDRPNSYALSEDDGATWSSPRLSDISGQTMTALPLGTGRLLVLYNRRRHAPGIIAGIVSLSSDRWVTQHEETLYQATGAVQADSGSSLAHMNDFQFGFPTMTRLVDGAILATYWSVEEGRCGVRWARLRVNPVPEDDRLVPYS